MKKNHTVGLYLKKNVSLVFTPNGSNGLKCYADSDFAGSWCREDADQVGIFLSRTGYIIKFENFPNVWASKMQPEIALSTTETEYISLSQRIRDLISLRQIMLNVSSVYGMKYDLYNSCTKTPKDNKVAIDLAKTYIYI